MQKTIIFFDIDSTLVENRFSPRMMNLLLQEVADTTGMPLNTLIRQMVEENQRRQKTDPNNLLTMDWDDIVEGIAQQYGVTLSRRVIDLWQEHATAEGVEMLDNALDVLRELKQPHRTLVIATKGLTKYQYPVLDAVKLRESFDDILAPDVTGYLKTQPEYFTRYTANHNGARFIQVGDHYYDDVICARRHGFHTIMRAPIPELKPLDPFERPLHLAQYLDRIPTYPKDGTNILPDAVVVTLQEVPDVVRRMEDL